jgi:transcriptional regulator with XRE-family HTH domain
MAITLKQAVGQSVRTARMACGLTQEDLAERINRTTETISNIERGKNPPSIETLREIAKTLNTSMDALVTGADRPVSISRLRHEAALTQILHSLDDDELETALRMMEAFAHTRHRKK